MSYEITQKFIHYNRPGIPLNPIGLVLHETANPNDSDEMETKYFDSGDRKASAHTFVGADSITQNIPFNEVAWHAGHTANYSRIGIELCHATTQEKFNEIWKRGVWLFAYLFVNVLKIKTVTTDNLMSHAEVSNKWHESDHQDPIEYFEQFNKTVDDFRNDVQKEINEMIGEEDMVVYKTINDIPDYGKDIIQKLITKGSIKGDGTGNINVSEDLVKTMVILEREGVLK